MKGMTLYLIFVMIVCVSAMVSAEETIDIAAIFALTGAAAYDNEASLRGVHWAVDEINQHGGILGKKINLLLFDNLSSPIGSSVAAQKAAAADVAAIVGAAWSSHSLAVGKVAQGQGIPMVSNFSTNPEVTKIGDYIFRICFTDDFQGRVIAKFARRDLNAATAIIFTDVTSDYSIGLAWLFQKNFEQSGGDVLFELEYKYKQQTFDPQIQHVKHADADVIFLSGHDESALIAKQLQDAGISSIPLGGDGWESLTFFSKGGSDLKLGYHSTHWSEFMDTDRSQAFVEKYKQGGSLLAQTALGYDAVMVLANAIGRSGSTDRVKIREALANTRNFEGVTGTISFNEHGDPVKSAVIMKIVDGEPRYLKTLKP